MQNLPDYSDVDRPLEHSAQAAQPTRRSFLMNTIVALPIAAAVSTAAPGMPSEDPVFVAIQKHKDAMRVLGRANAEQEQLFALADETVGPSRIRVLDMREPSQPPGWHPYVDVDCWVDIERYVSHEKHLELYAHYRAAFDELTAARSKFFEETAGDIDQIVNVPGEAEWDAADELTKTVPTTLPGLLAVVAYVYEAREAKGDIIATFDENNWQTLLASLAKAAKSLAKNTAA
jgi:hypothetical protein